MSFAVTAAARAGRPARSRRFAMSMAALGSNHHVNETRNPAVGRGRASEIMSRSDGRDKERPTKGQRNDARRNT